MSRKKKPVSGDRLSAQSRSQRAFHVPGTEAQTGTSDYAVTGPEPEQKAGTAAAHDEVQLSDLTTVSDRTGPDVLQKDISYPTGEVPPTGDGGVNQCSGISDFPTDNNGAPTEIRSLGSSYRLLRKIGEGGLGCVWLARDERLKRKVAIKQLKGSVINNAQVRARFHREAEITGLLEHPNVVPLHQFGIDESSGEPLYIMRFVGKRTLLDAIAEHRDQVQAGEPPELGLHRLLTAFLGVCQAIAHAHSRGVIHRDLKPANIALDNFGQVVVLDWGLAKLTEDSELATQLSDQALLGDTALAFTTHGDVVGTPLFMAPEQALGDLDKVDKNTDIYGLGAILFAILTGTAPHQETMNKHKREGSSEKALNTIAARACPRPQQIDGSVPPELDEICARAMAYKQHLRYSSVSLLAEATERWIVGQGAKKKRYDVLRSEGRELVAKLRSVVESLERSVEFMSNLPPIQELVRAEPEEDVTIWRERLATILTGLLGANREYRTAVYLKIDGDNMTEIVRIERHGNTQSRIRTLPKSCLREFAASEFLLNLGREKPDEIVTGLVADLLCEKTTVRDTSQSVGLASGVPIYDRRTEEPFGVLLIDCDLEGFIETQFSRDWQASEVLFHCGDVDLVLPIKSDAAKLAADNGASFSSSAKKPSTQSRMTSDSAYTDALGSLETHQEYIDDKNSEIYGARFLLKNTGQHVSYLLRH